MALVLISSAAGLYVLSWWLHPMQACPKCKGTSRFYGSLHKSKYRFCHACEGKGRRPRLGAKILIGMGMIKNPERTGSLGWRWRNRVR